MSHSLLETFLSRQVHRRLINRITDHKHVIDTNADKQERHQGVHATLFKLEGERQAETGKVAQNDTEKTARCDTAPTMNWAESANIYCSIDANHGNCHLDQE